MEVPQRRWRLQLDLGADNLHDLAAVLEELAFEAQTDKLPVDRVSGGSSTGYILTLTHDATMTPERFASENAAYVASLQGRATEVTE